jgi:hypothetical protein
MQRGVFILRLREGREMAALLGFLVPQLSARLVSRSSLEPRFQQAAFGLKLLGKFVCPTDLSRLQDLLS